MSSRLIATVMVREVELAEHWLTHTPAGVDDLELRLDALSEPTPERVQELLALPRNVPLIATCRSPTQGGKWDVADDERLALLITAAEAGADTIDVEDTLVQSVPEGLPAQVLASCHLSRFVPRLGALARRVAGRGARFAKLVVPADTPRQLLQLLTLQEEMGDAIAIVPTGRLSEAGRVLAAARGSPLTYGAVSEEDRGHPDQPLASRLHDVFAVSLVNASTRTFAVVGKPISHSLSPTFHNTVFRGVATNARMVSLDLDRLEDVVEAAEALRLDGLAVTHPFKRDAVRLANSVLPGAQTTGSANTLLRTPAGWQARNTDWKAACDLLPRLIAAWRKQQRKPVQGDWLAKVREGCWLARAVPKRKDAPAGKLPKVLLLGSGGAARAMAVALFDQEVELTIWSRRLGHARELASELADSVPAVAVPDPSHAPADIVVNATPVGMPGLGGSQLDGFGPGNFRPGAVAIDLTYGDEPSAFRDAARLAEVPLIRGEFFFALQGRRQAEAFTGAPVPPDLARLAAERCGAVEALE